MYLVTNTFHNSIALVHANADAPTQGEAHVLLGAVSELRGPQDVLPGHQVQQEQHGATRQMVLEFPVSLVFF